ncbi:unnamed protein product [Cylindrotheca closterium]|uniref:VOC domain-containing protein n=1 Tax=Cylindrotheca closterium TaxID=2856 RepID=A0AAD2CE23_9STRA|nr:unnamed protein product [Cylindrotheca closterium]
MVQPRTFTFNSGFLLSIFSGLYVLKWSRVSGFSSHFSTLRDSNIRISTKLFADREIDDENEHPLGSQSFLSHVMLKVPSVDRTVAYWIEKGGTVRVQTEKPGSSNGSTELKSAMLELGALNNDKDKSPCFALELIATNNENWKLGNEISYIGVSMLLQFQNNLLGAIKGDKPESQGDEPNGIPVESSASAPGDLLSRFALQSQNLEECEDFYTKVLGMEVKGKDDKMMCLRYDNDVFKAGVPTTLIFDVTEETIESGNCFDHLAIVTKASIPDLYAQSQNDSKLKIFMKPTTMFGKDVMGLIDPNGYKVVVASM